VFPLDRGVTGQHLCGVTGQYHKALGMSSSFSPQTGADPRKGFNAMKRKACWGLRLLLGLFLLAAGSGQPGGLGLVFQQIELVGARQWLNLLAGSMISSAPVVAPVSQRIARTFPRRPVALPADGTRA
jgi:hypothetical protein